MHAGPPGGQRADELVKRQSKAVGKTHMENDDDKGHNGDGDDGRRNDDDGRRDPLCIVPHMGLGDMIILNGMVRTACRSRDDVMLVAKKAYANSMRSLFCNIPNLRLKFVEECHELYANDFRLVHDIMAMGYELLAMGTHTTQEWRSLDPIWSRALYRQVGMDPDLMYDEFHVSRNLDREALMLHVVHNAVGKMYVVVHDDPRRGYVIDRACLPHGLPIVHVDDTRWRSDNIFDYAQVIDNAVQFHGFDSCFMLMADFLHLGRRNFCHAYLKDADMHDRFYRTDVTLLRTRPCRPVV